MTVAERNKLILEQIEKTRKRGLKSKKAARAILVRDGIYTEKGNLRKKFGGKGAPKPAPQEAV